MKQKWISTTGYTFAEGDQNVYDAALDRLRQAYDMDLPVFVSSSGGKDSTCVLALSLQVARERGKLPLEVLFFDEEVIDPETVKYCKAIRTMKDINLHWLCLNIRHTLQSKTRSGWTTWDDDVQHLWPREMPPWAISGIPLPDGASYNTAVNVYCQEHLGIDRWVSVLGIRVEEAFNRRRGMLMSGTAVNEGRHATLAKPIYDWKWSDVWRFILANDIPHSKHYDNLWMRGVSYHGQRIAAWGNAADRNTRFYPEFYPDFWQRAIKRLPELRAVARYQNTALFKQMQQKPAYLTWKQWAYYILDGMDADAQEYWLRVITGALRRWARTATVGLFDEPTEALDEISPVNTWKRLAQVISGNDRMEGGSRRLI